MACYQSLTLSWFRFCRINVGSTFGEAHSRGHGSFVLGRLRKRKHGFLLTPVHEIVRSGWRASGAKVADSLTAINTDVATTTTARLPAGSSRLAGRIVVMRIVARRSQVPGGWRGSSRLSSWSLELMNS